MARAHARALSRDRAAKPGLYFGAGLIFAAAAYLTNSLYAALVVHGMGFADPWFGPSLAAIAIVAPLAA
ncbi:hypothetical protein [Phenylobacterium sp.]|uniref:hypothetical protein n=1 Tax=Phenylobacterium sp. TaxID=1871053 RepID=UPI0026037B54|nr:hypothetical protein [Phenylobacterium sp.]